MKKYISVSILNGRNKIKQLKINKYSQYLYNLLLDYYICLIFMELEVFEFLQFDVDIVVLKINILFIFSMF